MSTTATRLLSPVAALALALTPVTVSGQTRAVPGEVVWHWFGECASSDCRVLEVSLDGKSLYSSAFPICQARRRDIRPQPQHRILEFRFDAAADRSNVQYHEPG